MRTWDTMGNATRLLVLLALTMLPVLAFAGNNCATIVNAGFEAGNFSGWNTYNTGASAVIGSYTDTNFTFGSTVAPYEGSKQARLRPDGAVVNSPGVESFLNVQPGYFTNIGLSRGAAISQSIYLFQGQQLSLAYYWAGHDYLPYDDSAFVTVQEPSPNVSTAVPVNFARVFQVASIEQYGDGYASALRNITTSYGAGSSGYLIWPLGAWNRGPNTWAALNTRTWNYEAPTNGWYVLGVAVLDGLDFNAPSDLLVDRAFCLDPAYQPTNAR
jgi:hypothetical protein